MIMITVGEIQFMNWLFLPFLTLKLTHHLKYVLYCFSACLWSFFIINRKYAEIITNTNLQLWLFSVHLSSEIVWSLQKTLLHTRTHTEYSFWVWNWIKPVSFLKKYSWIYNNIFTRILYNIKNKKMYSSVTL